MIPRFFGVAGAAVSLFVCAAALAVDGNVIVQSTKIIPPAPVGSSDEFGSAFASLGNLNGSGGPDVAIGVDLDNAVYVYFLDAQGVPLSNTRISSSAPLGSGRLGRALAFLGDMDGDGNPELAIGAPTGSGGGIASGVVYIAELNPATGAVVSALRIASGENGFPTSTLDSGDDFGDALAAGDLNGDGRPELIVGARYDDDGGTDRGAFYILYLNANGTVSQATKVSGTAGSFGYGASLVNFSYFGESAAVIPRDLDGDGQYELAIGAPALDTGSVFLLFLSTACGTAGAQCLRRQGGHRRLSQGRERRRRLPGAGRRPEQLRLVARLAPRERVACERSPRRGRPLRRVVDRRRVAVRRRVGSAAPAQADHVPAELGRRARHRRQSRLRDRRARRSEQRRRDRPRDGRDRRRRRGERRRSDLSRLPLELRHGDHEPARLPRPDRRRARSVHGGRAHGLDTRAAPSLSPVGRRRVRRERV